jgi:undecaprenyl diphosphate synthase
MTQSSSSPVDPRLHVAIIMDGNGRWAVERGMPRVAGHRAGAAAVKRTVEAAPGLGIDTLTLFAFSADNWRRPRVEVDALMTLLEEFLGREAGHCAGSGVRLSVTGRRDRLPRTVLAAIAGAEAATAGGDRLDLRLAVDYSGREALLAAATALVGSDATGPEGLGAAVATVTRAWPPRDVDLLIRTGGEQRLSDFLLWECAYAELVFTPVRWPDFGASDLEAALACFHRRERRFGGLAGVAAS